VKHQLKLGSGCLRIVAVVCVSLSCFGAEPPPKPLMDYIEEAQKLGLEEETIRRNAVSGGWDAKLVEDAVNALKNPRLRTLEPGVELPEGYRIGAGDVIAISVWKEPEASVDGIVVRADGKVSLPLVKEIEIAGLTPTEAEKLLAERLAKFILSPDVTVIIKAINSRKVYLVGAVRNGSINLTSRMSVLQVLTVAGGVTDYAKRKRIYILRNLNGKQTRFPFNYDAVIKGEQIEQNIPVEPDDIIVVPH
jgi:polysaccharide export outer membrane protein